MKTFLHKEETKVQIIMLAIMLMLGFSLKAQYNYLGNYDSNGKPLYLETVSDLVTESFLSDINASLPESMPVPTYNPHYISAGTETDIHLKDSAAVWVTFVAEGAGYKNVLGFYTYDLNNPPQNVNEIQNETIIFPNVSALGSGGSLLAGDKVKLGNFSAGTGIGWFLIADGWRNGAVGNGNWKVYSNPDFNPESNPTDRNHNVLLNDTVNQRIVLGFEDIRRDYSSCDQDFNDAIFYVSANPYTAIITDSINSITNSGNGVSSGGNGGLESNGKLATKIASRNFERQKSQDVDYNNFEALTALTVENVNSGKVKSLSRNKSNHNLQELIPTQSLFGTQALVSTPQDLLSITNAHEVFAADYVSNQVRQGAAMVMYTQGAVYEHTKAVCDRLKGASLLNINEVSIAGGKFILFQLKQADGKVEYAINFVAQEQANGDLRIESKWNLEDYPSSPSNYNFQFWSSTSAMTISLVENALKRLFSRANIYFNNSNLTLPNLYVKAGKYENGKLKLRIKNELGVHQLELKGNLSRNELAQRENVQLNIPLNGNLEEDIEIDLGSFFDFGFSLKSNQIVSDVLYTADGSWGSDYEQLGATVFNMDIKTESRESTEAAFLVERSLEASGTVNSYISFFRQLKAAGESMDLQKYNAISLNLNCSHDVELRVLESSINQWNQQAKIMLKPNVDGEHLIYLDDLFNGTGSQLDRSKIQTLAFTLVEKTGGETPFYIEINEVAFVQAAERKKVVVEDFQLFPNPTLNRSQFQIYLEQEQLVSYAIYGMNGQRLQFFENTLTAGYHTLEVNLENYPSGIYFIRTNWNERSFLSKLVKK